MKNYSKILKEELAKRMEANPYYSLRAFSRSLQLTPGGVSEIVAGKRGLSLKRAQKILLHLNLSPEKEKEFLKPFFSNLNKSNEIIYNQINSDMLKVMSTWYYFALLSLACLENSKSDEEWVAHRLGISTEKSKEALDRLEKLQLIKRKKGKLTRTSTPLQTSDGVPSIYLQKLHSEFLLKSIENLKEVPVDLRDNTAMVMSIDPKNIKKAKLKIKNFRRSLAKLMESGNQSEVYALNISLTPLTKNEDTK